MKAWRKLNFNFKIWEFKFNARFNFDCSLNSSELCEESFDEAFVLNLINLYLVSKYEINKVCKTSNILFIFQMNNTATTYLMKFVFQKYVLIQHILGRVIKSNSKSILMGVLKNFSMKQIRLEDIFYLKVCSCASR